MVIIPSTYLPSISQIAQILRASSKGESVVMDLGENYIKRSERNRTRIMTAQGVMELTVPVQRANKPRQAMHSIKIDYSKRWQHQHWISILSVYKSSPYFDHFAPYIEPIYKREYTHLIDLNADLLKMILKLLRLENSIKIDSSNIYIEAAETDTDLRIKGAALRDFTPQPYIQVFEDRQPFESDLSILDLLMCEGPSAVDFL